MTRPSPGSRSLLARGWPWALAFAGWMALALRPEIAGWLGFQYGDKWFLDTHALLSALDAHRAGLDPGRPNPFDVLGRPHSYSDWWYALGWLGLDRTHNTGLGLTFVGLLVVAGWAVARPSTWWQGAGLALLLGSPAVLLAVHRANNDLVILALLALAGWVWPGEQRWRVPVAWVCLALATGLKFYPVAAGALFLLLRPAPRLRRVGVPAVLGLGLILASVAEALPRGQFAIGVSIHSLGLPILLGDLGLGGPGFRVAASLALLAGGFWLAKAGVVTWSEPEPEDGRGRAWFVLGAAVLLACFLGGVSHAYRWVFLLLLLPGWWRESQRGSRVARLALGLALVIVWADGLLALLANFGGFEVPADQSGLLSRWRLATQPLHWWLMLLLAGWLAAAGAAAWRAWRADGQDRTA